MGVTKTSDEASAGFDRGFVCGFRIRSKAPSHQAEWAGLVLDLAPPP
jgi:hypothetical protein